MLQRSQPLVRVVLSFSAGIWCGLESGFTVLQLIPATLLLGLFSFLVFHRKGWLPYPQRWMAGLTIRASVFFMAFLVASLQDQRLSRLHESGFNADSVVVELTQPFVRKQLNFRSRGRVVMLRGKKRYSDESRTNTENRWYASQGEVLLYFSPDDSLNLPAEGDLVLVNGPVARIMPPRFPGQFDFRTHCALSQCYGALYPKKGECITLGKASDVNLLRWAHQLRSRLIGAFRQAGLKDQELAVVSALVLGDDDAVDPELIRSFSATGTLHVLSVSGMHVGILYACVAFLLGKFFKSKEKKWQLTISVLLIVWWYALLTGLSPAVQRSAMMITLVLTGKTFFKAADTWNLLCASFMILIAIDPALIRSAGFQLSYAAVAGIIGFYPWLYGRYTARKNWIDLLWKSTCVALSAQVFTFPLGLYYFHQFPNYFLPANLIIIPLSTAVLFSGIVLTCSLPFPPLAHLFGYPVSILTMALNRSVRLFGDLPHAQLSGIWISGTECMLLMAAVVAAVLFLSLKKNHWLFASLSLTLVMGCSMIINDISHIDRLSFYQWSRKGGQPFTIVYGNSAITIGTTPEEIPERNFQNRFEPAMDALRIAGEHRFIYGHSEGLPPVPVVWCDPYLVLPDTVLLMTTCRSPHVTEVSL